MIIPTMKSKQSKWSSVAIPSVLSNKIKERIEGTGFITVSSYVTFILREIVMKEKDKVAFYEDDKGRVISKLRKLGYLKQRNDK